MEIFNEGGLRIMASPVGVILEAKDVKSGAHAFVPLLEGSARRAGLALRTWVREQKEARGDTPRGMKELERRRARAAAKP